MGLTHFTLIMGGICTAIAAIAGLILMLFKANRKANAILDDALGRPGYGANPEATRRPGWSERLGTIEDYQHRHDQGQLHIIQQIGGLETRIFRIEAQVYPDHGYSLFDRVDRIEQQTRRGQHRKEQE